MPPSLPIYLDNAATTPMDPRVLEAMMPFFTREFGNAASRNHEFGLRAQQAVEGARRSIAQLIGAASDKEIVFTSGATESNNLAIKGIAERCREKGNHIVTCKTEHKAVLDTCRHLEQQGFEVTYLDVDGQGRVDPDDVRKAIRPGTVLVSIMLANNEIGTLHPVEDIGKITRERDILFHCDAVQGVAKVDFHVQRMNIDLASLSAHKMYGPKGVGALFVRRSGRPVRPAAQLHGGGHERGLRSGTPNVPGVVGFGRAASLALEEWRQDSDRILGLRDRLQSALVDGLEDVYLNGSDDSRRVPGILNLSFSYVSSQALMMAVKQVAVSAGSACTSASLEPSYVLRALGMTEERANAAVRFSIGKFNTGDEIDYVSGQVIEHVTRLRRASPLYRMRSKG